MLTEEQYQSLKQDMVGRESLQEALLSGDDVALTAFYNSVASPMFLVWKTWVTKEEAFEQALDWSEVGSLTAAEEKIWSWMFQAGGMNPSKPNIRAGMATALSSAVNTRAALVALSVRPGTVFEKLFSTGAGTSIEPATMAIEGPVDVSDVSRARGNY